MQILQNLQNVANFLKIQLDNIVDFDKCWKARIYLQKSVPIQPKKSEILEKIANCHQLPDADADWHTLSAKRVVQQANDP